MSTNRREEIGAAVPRKYRQYVVWFTVDIPVDMTPANFRLARIDEDEDHTVEYFTHCDIEPHRSTWKIDNMMFNEPESNIISGEEAERIYNALVHPSPDPERDEMIRRAREEFPHPERPTELDIEFPDDPDDDPDPLVTPEEVEEYLANEPQETVVDPSDDLPNDRDEIPDDQDDIKWQRDGLEKVKKRIENADRLRSMPSEHLDKQARSPVQSHRRLSEIMDDMKELDAKEGWTDADYVKKIRLMREGEEAAIEPDDVLDDFVRRNINGGQGATEEEIEHVKDCIRRANTKKDAPEWPWVCDNRLISDLHPDVAYCRDEQDYVDPDVCQDCMESALPLDKCDLEEFERENGKDATNGEKKDE